MAKRRNEGAYRVIRGIAWPNPAGGEWIEIGAIEPADTIGESVTAAEEV